MEKITNNLLNPNIQNSLNDTLGIQSPSVFYGHSMPVIHQFPIFNSGANSYWPSIFLFAIFSLYVFIKISEPKKLTKVFLAVFSLQEAKQLFREDYKLTKRVSVLLIIGYILVIAFLIQYTNNYFGLILNSYSPLHQYLIFIGLLIFILFIKYLSNALFAFVLKSGDLNREYLFYVFVFSQTAGIIILPFIISLQFTEFPKEVFLYPALVIAACFYALRTVRVFTVIGLEQNIGIAHIILYLCALEILPVLVLIKFLLINFKN